ncbi:hypothetical protein ACIBKZ_33815 [Streptomyces sp. NPDC050421]|uniref:hypothetical protein n=1 Tax=unclassified Streptomyces TaxID=2593676 RepID=UPI0037962551
MGAERPEEAGRARISFASNTDVRKIKGPRREQAVLPARLHRRGTGAAGRDHGDREVARSAGIRPQGRGTPAAGPDHDVFLQED